MHLKLTISAESDITKLLLSPHAHLEAPQAFAGEVLSHAGTIAVTVFECRTVVNYVHKESCNSKFCTAIKLD
jgi:hypothetical protein